MHVFGDKLHVGVEESAAAGEAIRVSLERAGAVVGEIRRIRPTVEDVFVELMTTGRTGGWNAEK